MLPSELERRATKRDIAEIMASAALDDPKSKISIDIGDERARELLRAFRAGEIG